MKKSLIVAIIILLSSSLNAQTEEHLKFKGIPINGSLNEFVSKLKKKGFDSEMEYDSKATILFGDFAGYRNCKIFVMAGANGNVKNVGVNISDNETDWKILYWQYSNLKNMLTTKYGMPSYSIERFNGLLQPETDNDKIRYTKRGDCEYETAWQFENGHIKLLISHMSFNYEEYCYVSLIYVDYQNNELDSNSAIDDL